MISVLLLRVVILSKGSVIMIGVRKLFKEQLKQFNDQKYSSTQFRALAKIRSQELRNSHKSRNERVNSRINPVQNKSR